MVSIAATPSGVSKKAFDTPADAISLVRMRLPGSSGSSVAMSISS